MEAAPPERSESMRDLSTRLQQVQRAARRGAKSMTESPALIDLAEEEAIHGFEQAVLAGRAICNLASWAFAVGKNAVRSHSRTRGRPAKLDADRLVDAHPASGPQGGPPPVSRRRLGTWLRRHREHLRGNQFKVCQVLAAGASYHAAARLLGMDRTNLKRTFRSALRRLARVIDEE